MLRWFASVLVLLLLILHSLPLLIRDQAVIWLRQHGAEDARLKAIEIDWLDGRLKITGLEARAEGKPVILLGEFIAALDYRALFQQRLLLQQISISGVQLGVRQQEGGFWLGPIDLQALSIQGEATEAGPSDSNWSFGLQQLTLANIDWRADLPGQKHHLQLQQGELKDLLLWAPDQPLSVMLEGKINGAPLRLNSESVPLPERKTSQLNIRLQDFPLHSVTAAFLPTLRARIDLDLKIQASGNLDLGDSQLQQTGSISVRNLAWQQDALALQQQQLDWSGSLKADWREGKLNDITSDSQLQLQGLQLQQPEFKLTLDSATAKAAVQGQAPAQWQTDIGELVLNNARIKQGELDIALQQGRVQAGAALVDGQPETIRLDQLNLEQLDVARGAADPLRIKLNTLSTAGQIRQDSQQGWQANLPAVALNQLRMSVGSQALASLQALNAKQLDLSGTTERLTLQDTLLTGLSMEGQEQPITQWQKIRAQQLQLQDLAQLEIDDLALSGGNIRLQLSDTRRVPELDWWLAQLGKATAGDNVQPVTPDAEVKADGSFRTRIGALHIEGDSKIDITDQGVSPAVTTAVVLQSVVLAPLDTASDQTTRINLQSRIGQFTKLDVEGELELFSGNYGGDWQLNLKGLELPLVSPYFSHYTGYLLKSGQLNLSSEGSIKERQLKGDTDIRLNRLDVTPDKSDRSTQFNKKVTMPLETAIMVLQDKDQNIQLDLPLNGSLDDPQFGYQAIINRLAGKGLKNAALGYLTKALQPFGALITVAEFAIDAAEKGSFIRLQPVPFAPSVSDIQPESNAYLDKLAGMLKERPAMRLNICGQAVAADAGPLRQQLQKEQPDLKPEDLTTLLQERLQQLAVARGDVIKQQLSEQHQISVERLFTCYPEVNATSDQPPQTLLGL